MIKKSRVVFGDCRVVMQQWIDWGIKVQMCVTSPPYFGLRDYNVDGQLGLEPTPEEFVSNLVGVFRLVRELLADDGVLWLNLGDSYCSTAPGTKNSPMIKGSKKNAAEWANARPKTPPGLKPKDLIGIPWRVAFALQADGWWLRQDIIWHKLNPMPESVTDRCTKSHEYLFLLSKQPRYYYDNDAIREPSQDKNGTERFKGGCGVGERNSTQGWSGGKVSLDKHRTYNPLGRNRHSVWPLSTKPYKGAHFATFPPTLIEPCILAGSRRGDTVLDPFFGSGTTGMVAKELGRKWLGCELNKDYEALMLERLGTDMVSTMANENHYYPR